MLIIQDIINSKEAFRINTEEWTKLFTMQRSNNYIWLGFDITIGEYCLYNSLGEKIETLNQLLDIGDGLHTDSYLTFTYKVF